MSIRCVNPATEELVATYEPHSPAAIEAAVAQAHEAHLAWRTTSFSERADKVRALARVLRERKTELGRLITSEMGKPILESEAEIEKCAWNCEHYAEFAPRYLAPEAIPSSASESYVAFEPLGIVLAIMPWNFPFWQVFRFLAPAFMAGNSAILKHASNVSGCALAIEDVVKAAGLPAGLHRTLLMAPKDVDALIADDRVQAITLTGSSEVGALVAATSGKHLKKQVLELGGSDPFIVLDDADVELAAQTAARARNQNTGQSCIAGKRFIVEQGVYARFTELLGEAVAKLRVGDPMDRTTEVGPLARNDLRDSLQRQVDESLKQGARLVVGGKRREGKGYFYLPTVLADVTPEMTAFREETFGPVAAVIKARDAAHAVRLANDSPFGLGGALWTRDIARAKKLAREIQSGAVFINGLTASDPRLPFGGVKKSGYGRELGAYGIREFTNIQTVWIGPSRVATTVLSD